jgi:hypothetical protein
VQSVLQDLQKEEEIFQKLGLDDDCDGGTHTTQEIARAIMNRNQDIQSMAAGHLVSSSPFRHLIKPKSAPKSPVKNDDVVTADVKQEEEATLAMSTENARKELSQISPVKNSPFLNASCASTVDAPEVDGAVTNLLSQLQMRKSPRKVSLGNLLRQDNDIPVVATQTSEVVVGDKIGRARSNGPSGKIVKKRVMTPKTKRFIDTLNDDIAEEEAHVRLLIFAHLFIFSAKLSNAVNRAKRQRKKLRTCQR